MRDIQSDLQERATLIVEQIRAARAHFERILEKLQNKRDARIADLQSGLAMIAKFTEFEQQFFGNVSPPVPSSPLVALADLFMRKLNEVGPISREELVDMAVKQGFFPRRRNRVAGRAPYGREHVAKRTNSRV